MSNIKMPDFKRIDSATSKLDAALAARNGAGARPIAPAAHADDGVILIQGSTLMPAPISWLWKHWLALGKLHLLAGAPGQGKTTLALAMMAAVTVGGRWPDGSRCERGNVLMWSGEDDPADTLLPRLMAMGADRSRVYFIRGTRIAGEETPFDPARDLVQLTAAVERVGDVRLLVVDPVVSAVTGDSHKNTEVRRALQPLVDLAARIDAAALGISHLSKGTAGRDPTERVTGSVAFTAVVRVVLLAAKVKGKDGGKDKRILVRSKSNIGPDDGGFEYFIEQGDLDGHPRIEASRIEWGPAIEGTARDLLAEAEADPANDGEGTATDDAADALKRIIGRDTVPSRDVVAQMKTERFSEKVIRSARERIGVVVKRAGFGAAMVSYWKLPDGTAIPDTDAIHALPAPFVPIDAHNIAGHEWARMESEGTTQEADDPMPNKPADPSELSRESAPPTDDESEAF